MVRLGSNSFILRTGSPKYLVDLLDDRARQLPMLTGNENEFVDEGNDKPGFARRRRCKRDRDRQGFEASFGHLLLQSHQIVKALAVEFVANFSEWQALGLIQ